MERILGELYRDLWDARHLKQDDHLIFFFGEGKMLPSKPKSSKLFTAVGGQDRTTGMKLVPLLIFALSAWPLCVCETFEDGQPDVAEQYSEKLRSLGLDKFTVQKEVTAIRALQSERAGVTEL